MNRLILKYKYPITFAILAVLAWVVYRYFSMGGSQLMTFVVVAVLVWGLGTFVFLYFWPPITYSAYKRAVVVHGLGAAPSQSIRFTRCPISLRPRRQTPAY